MISFLASIILSVKNFFNNLVDSFNIFFDIGEEYVAENIKNGKIFYDFYEVEKRVYKISYRFCKQTYASPPAQRTLGVFFRWTKVFENIPSIKKILEVLFEISVIYKNFSKSLIFSLSFGVFPLVSLLIYLLVTYTHLFFVYFIPIIIVILLIESALFYFIDKRVKNEKISFLSNLSNFPEVILLFLFYIFSCTFILFLFTFIIFLFIPSLNIFALPPIILLVILMLGFLVLLSILYLGIWVDQAYFIVLLEKEAAIPALVRGAMLLQKSIYSVLIDYLVVFLIFSFIVYNAFLYLKDPALIFVLAFILHFSLLFAYAWRKKTLQLSPITIDLPRRKKPLYFFYVLFFVGIVSYIAFSSITVRSYKQFLSFYEKWKLEKDILNDFQLYQNIEYGFSIGYPRSWSVYQWNNKSVTLHYNANNTSLGRVSVNIEILSPNESNYYKIKDSKVGEVIYETTKNEYIKKVSNLLLGGYNGFKYKSIREGSLTEYRINYLVLRGERVYKISLVSVDPVIQQAYTKIFDLMIGTLLFTK